MHATKLESSFLLEQFQEFYQEVIRQKALIADQGNKIASASPSEPTIADKAQKGTFRAVQSDLIRLLEEQVLSARRRGDELGVAYYKKAQYVMVALADEIFLQLKWCGQALWQDNLLELKFFNSHVAGENIFELIERLLKERDQTMNELAAVYLLGLTLGFRGQYRREYAGGKLNQYRSQLFSLIYDRDPELQSASKKIFAGAYEHTLDRIEKRRIPYIRRWILLIILLLVIYLVVSHGFWEHLTQELVAITDDIVRGGYAID